MTRRFSHRIPDVGAPLPPNTFGRLVAEFRFASHIPLRGGRDTGRHIYLALAVPGHNTQAVYEAAVNIRSDQGTDVQFAERIENLSAAQVPAPGFQGNVHLAYGRGGEADDPNFMGLSDADFAPIVNDALYDRVSKLTQGCDRIAVYGVTYAEGDGIHDAHMNSGTDPDDTHAGDDRVRQDGAVAFYFNLNGQQAFARWLFIKFKSQSVVNFGSV